MARKGSVAEIFSRALHSDDPDLYVIGYLDFSLIKEVPLKEFLILSENFQVIPASRIMHIKRGGRVLYSRQITKKDPDPC